MKLLGSQGPRLLSPEPVASLWKARTSFWSHRSPYGLGFLVHRFLLWSCISFCLFWVPFTFTFQIPKVEAEDLEWRPFPFSNRRAIRCPQSTAVAASHGFDRLCFHSALNTLWFLFWLLLWLRDYLEVERLISFLNQRLCRNYSVPDSGDFPVSISLQFPV